MKSIDIKKVGVVGFIAMLLNGCGGGGGGGGGGGIVPLTGIIGHVADGSVSGAKVKFDLNDNGICGGALPLDAAENLAANQASTDAQGNFAYPAGISATHLVCASGGIDISTGAAFIGELKASAGASQITPLTSLIQAAIEAAMPVGAYTAPLPATVAAAASTIALNLGLSGVNLLTADPVALASTNPKLAQTTTAVQVMLVQIANNVIAAATSALPTSTAQTTALYGSAVAGLAAALSLPLPPVDLTTKNPATTTAVSALVNSAVSQTVNNVQNNPVAAANVPGVALLNPAYVAAAASDNITTLTQNVGATSAAILLAPSSLLPGSSLLAQTSNTGAQITAGMASTGLLDTVNTGVTGTVAQISATIQTTAASANTTALTGANAAAIATAIQAGISSSLSGITVVTPPVATVPAAPAFTNYLPIIGITVTGVTPNPGAASAINTVAANGTVTVTGGISTATLNFGAAVGTPPFAPNVSASFSVRSTVAGDNRSLTGTFSGMTVINGVLSETATASATISGVHANGTTATITAATATNPVATLPWITGNFISGGNATLNVGRILTDLTAATTTGTAGLAGFSNLNLLKGNFSVTLTLSGIPVGNTVAYTPTQTVNIIVN